MMMDQYGHTLDSSNIDEIRLSATSDPIKDPNLLDHPQKLKPFLRYRRRSEAASRADARLGFAVTILLICASTSALAQELRDHELKPAFDFSTVQMPVEIVSIKLKGKEVAPGEKIKGDDDRLKSLSFTLKNISDKPIAY